MGWPWILTGRWLDARKFGVKLRRSSIDTCGPNFRPWVERGRVGGSGDDHQGVLDSCRVEDRGASGGSDDYVGWMGPWKPDTGSRDGASRDYLEHWRV